MKKKIAGIFGLWLLLMLMACPNVLAAAPKMNAPVTKNNILALLDAYDADSAYILRTMSNRGDNILKWWSGESSLVGAIDTAVHEEFHGYSLSDKPWKGEDIFVGNKKSIRVNYTKTFRSKKMGATIPANLRTMRWSTYVGKPVANTASDLYGAYGLLNEFAAYYWGMRAQLSLFHYFQSNHATPTQWREFVNTCANDRLAYAEFKYYILNYLVYAKKHNSSVYKGIIKNSKFISAYKTIESRFAALIATFEQDLNRLEAFLQTEGYDASVTYDAFYIGEGGGGYAIGLFRDDYDRLINELQKSQYQTILSGGGKTTVTVEGTQISSLKALKKGFKVSWKKVKNASGYQIMYAKNKKFSSAKKVKVKASASSKTIKSLSKKKTYYVKVRAYRKKSGKTYYSPWSDVKQVKTKK